MSEALTAKQEAFCLAYIEVGNASEAYRRAYDVSPETKPESIWVNASKLLADAKVKQRVEELREEARALAMVSVDSLTQELEEARQLAMRDEKGASAAVSAIMGKAKLHGLLIDKKQLTGEDGKPLIPEDSPRERARAIAFILASGLEGGAE